MSIKGAAPDPVELPLERARGVAEKMAGSLLEFCERVEIAGSIRRGRAMVGDIDLVCLPKSPAALDQLRAKVRKPNPYTISDGNMNLLLIYDDAQTRQKYGGALQLDLFFASHEERNMFGAIPANFGSLLLCRTGSKMHNIFLVNRAKKLGLSWKPMSGVWRGAQCLASETEEAIFAALELEFVKPEDRER